MTPIVVNFSPALTDSHWMTSKGWRAVFRGVAERIDLLNLWILLVLGDNWPGSAFAAERHCDALFGAES